MITSARAATYRESLDAVRPLVTKFGRPHVPGGTVKKVTCPACHAGVFTLSKEDKTGLVRGSCTTSFCVNFSEI